MLEERQQPTALTPEEIITALIPSLAGSSAGKRAGIAAFTILAYDHLLTLDDEIRFFWTGKWTLSRVLYFLNRYFPHLALILGIIVFVTPGLSLEFCDGVVRTIFALSVAAMLVAEGVLVLRIWYLYRHSRVARFLVVSCFFICFVDGIVTLVFTLPHIKTMTVDIPGIHALTGCQTPPPQHVWRLFVPVLVLHTILYGFTAYRGLRNRSVVAEAAPVMARLLRDGGILYLVVLVSVGMAAICSTMAERPLIQIPAIYSNLMLSLTSICVSRIMLNIRSLAADLVSDPTALLLSNTELSRVHWRKGTNSGDILVDMDDRRRYATVEIGMQVRHEHSVEDGPGSKGAYGLDDKVFAR